MRQSSIPAPSKPIEVQLFGDGLRGAGRRGVAGGKRGPAFDTCENCDGAATAVAQDGGLDGRLVTVQCPTCTPVAA